MSNPEWGIKRVCPSCSIKYYDFNKNPITCPKCEFEFDPDLLLKSRKGRGIALKIEDDTASNNPKKENETFEEDIHSIENNEEILEIDDDSDIEDINNDLEKNVSSKSDDIEITDDALDQKDNFSIEIVDEIDNNGEDKD